MDVICETPVVNRCGTRWYQYHQNGVGDFNLRPSTDSMSIHQHFEKANITFAWRVLPGFMRHDVVVSVKHFR